MGYNSRALRLHQVARIVVGKLKGRLPTDVESLRELPGIGRYTANAVACFAFGKNVPVVDTNVTRVFGRLYPRGLGRLQHDREYYWELATAHLPRSAAHEWNQALMDLGATICRAARPLCGECPVERQCPSAYAVRKNPERKKSEKGRHGIPNRIYRGRVIETLRTFRKNDAMSIATVARRSVPEFRPADATWFRSVLKNLERDGLVRFRGKTKISLPD